MHRNTHNVKAVICLRFHHWNLHRHFTERSHTAWSESTLKTSPCPGRIKSSLLFTEWNYYIVVLQVHSNTSTSLHVVKVFRFLGMWQYTININIFYWYTVCAAWLNLLITDKLYLIIFAKCVTRSFEFLVTNWKKLKICFPVWDHDVQ